MANVGSLVVDIAANVGRLQTDMEKARKVISRLDKNTRKVKSSMDRFENSIKRIAVAAIGFVAARRAFRAFTDTIKGSINAANELNVAMANVATLIPKNSKRIQELKKDVQALSVEVGKSTTDLAGGLFQVVSAFGDAADSAQKLRIVAKAATAGLSTTTEALELTSAVTKGYGETTAEAVQKAADLAFMTNKLGQTTFPELAQSIGTVVPLAAKMGVQVEELFAGFATLTGVTGDANKVSTQLAAIMRAGIKPTEGMKDAVKELDERYQDLTLSSASAIFKQFGMVEGMKLLVSTTDGSEEAIGKLFSRVEGLTALFALTGAQSDTFTSKLMAMRNASGATEEAFKEQTEGISKFDFQTRQLGATWEVFLQKMGDFITTHPKVVNAIGSITSALQQFAKMVGLDVRSQVAILIEEIELMEKAQAAGVISLDLTTFAGRKYAVLLTELSKLQKDTGKESKAFGDILNDVGKDLNNLGGEGLDEVIESSIDFEKKIRDIVIATKMLNATTLEKIELQKIDLALSGASVDVITRFVQAKKEQLAVEQQIESMKAATERETDKAENLRNIQQEVIALRDANFALTASEGELLEKELEGFLARGATIEQIVEINALLMEQAEIKNKLAEVSFASTLKEVGENNLKAKSVKGLSNVFTASQNAMTDSILNFIETGKFSVKQFAQIVAQTVKIELAGIAARAAILAIFHTAMGFAFLATGSFVQAGQAFTSAAIFGGIGIAAIGAAAGVHALAGGGAERPSAGQPGGDPLNVTTEEGGIPAVGGGVAGRAAQFITVNIRALDPANVDMDRLVENNIAPALERLSGRDGRNVVLDLNIGRA